MIDRILRVLRDHALLYLKRKGKKALIVQAREMLALYRAYKYLPYHYLKHSMYLRSFSADPLDYLPPEIVHRYRDDVNPRESRNLVRDKKRFFQLMKAKDFPIIPNLFSISGDGIIKSAGEQEVGFDDMLLALRKSTHKEFFVKPSLGEQGRGTIIATMESTGLTVGGKHIQDGASFFASIASDEVYDEYLLQPRFVQHEVLNRINPASLNVVRIDTLVQENTVRQSVAKINFSDGKMIVCGYSCGGPSVQIDLKTGTLAAVGKVHAKYGGGEVRHHPMTKVRFEGIVVPFWPALIDLVSAAALTLEPLKYLGWDVAIGPDGPVIVEANPELDIYFMQEACGGLRHTAIGQAVLQRGRLTVGD